MRKLKTLDVFEALRLVQKSGLKDQLVPLIERFAKKPEEVQKAGILGVLTLIEVFADNKCEDLIYKWLAGPFECDPDEVRNMELDDLATKLKELTEENDLRNFFTVLSGLLGRKP